MIKRFDLVRLKTVARVNWLSGPASAPASPQGVWSVVAGVEGSDVLLLARDETLIRIPVEDVIKVSDYDVQNAREVLRRIKNKKDLRAYQIKKGEPDGRAGRETQ
jgi:hypothetical protein